MPGEECRGIGAHRPSLVIPYCWRRLTYFQTPIYCRPSPAREHGIIDAAPTSLGEQNPKEPKNNSGKPAPNKNTCWRARHHRRRPRFPWRMKHRRTQKAQGNKAPRTKLWGNKSPMTNYKEELLLFDETLGTKEELPLGDKTPGTITTTTTNLQGCGWTTKSLIWGKKPQGQKKIFR